MRVLGFDIRRSAPAEARSLEREGAPLRDPAAFRQFFGLSEWLNAAGVAVTAETVMGIPAFASGVIFLANTIASLPLHEYKRTADGGRERVEGGMLSGILTGTVNDDFLTSFKWRKNAMTSVFLTGAGRTYIETNAAGGPVNLWPLDTGYTTKRRVGGRTLFEYRASTTPPQTYRAGEVIDLTWADKLDGVSVFNPVERFRETFGLALAVQKYGAKFFQNGGVPPLALKGPLGSPAATTRAKGDVGKAVREANRAGDQVLAVPDGYDLAPIGFDPEKGQLVDVQKFLVLEFARILNLPPVFLQDLSSGNFNNTEQQDLLLVKHSITHWVEQFEQEFNTKFYGPRQTARFVEFDLDGIQRGDFKSRIEGWARGIQTGQVMPSEVRRAENRPFVEGSDRLFVQGATVPLEDAGKTTAAAPPPAPADDPPADDQTQA